MVCTLPNHPPQPNRSYEHVFTISNDQTNPYHNRHRWLFGDAFGLREKKYNRNLLQRGAMPFGGVEANKFWCFQAEGV